MHPDSHGETVLDEEFKEDANRFLAWCRLSLDKVFETREEKSTNSLCVWLDKWEKDGKRGLGAFSCVVQIWYGTDCSELNCFLIFLGF